MFFRAGTIEEAKKLGVVGHVENTSSGTVTGEVQGEPKPVSQMKVSLLQCNSGLLQRRNFRESCVQDWLQHKGPSGARIDKCSITNERSDLDKLTYSGFEKH